MNKAQFNSVLHTYISDVINLIIIHSNCSEDDAIIQFMNSKTCQLLCEEETKLWHLSSNALYEMYIQEKNGNFYIPEVY